MSTMKLSAKGGGDFFRLRFWAAALLMLGMLLMLGVGQANAAPLAGTSIGNQASATYLDNGGTSRVTVSNSVSTIVSQVSNATLTQSQTKTGAPGQPISFPHTVTNNGNGPENFTIGTATLTGNTLAALPVLYADANCDGVADNATTITALGPIAPGAQACFVAQGTLNSSGTTNSTFQVTAISTLTGTPTATGSPNTDTAVISNNGVIAVSKSVDISTGPAGTVVTYTLTYRNTGTTTATGVVLADLLQSGVTVGTTTATLVPKFNGTALAGALGTVQGTTPNRINVAIDTIGAAQRFVAVIESVPANTQGTVSFVATQSGAGPVNNNNSQYCYNDGTAYVATAIAANCSAIVTGSGVSSGTVSGSYNNGAGSVLDNNAPAVTGNTTNTSNTVPFNVTTTSATGLLAFNDGTTNNGTPGGDGTVGGAGNVVDGSTNPTTQAAGAALDNVTAGQRENVNLIGTAAQGSVVVFNNWVWNVGTTADTFNISTISTNNFPNGTSFQFMRADGVTPLTDSNSDGVLDTGPIPGTGGVACPTGSPNATSSATTPCGYRVVVRAILPSTASGGPFNVVVQAASSLSPATVNSVVDRLGAITASTVDLKSPFSTTNNYIGGGSTWAANCAFVDLSVTVPNYSGTCSTYVSGGGNGQQATGEVNPVVVISTTPASTVRYRLDVVNTGTVADSFDLAYNVGNGAYTVGAPGFTTPGSLPSGYQLRFFLDGGAGNCSTIGAQIANTGVVPVAAAPANIRTVCAQVDIPAGAPSATYDLYFRAQSPSTATATTGSSADVMHAQMFINTVRSVTITPNNSGQIFPGGSISYCHTVTNAGNANETAVTIGNANSLGAPWPTTATLYRDTNNNCTLDAGETTPLATNPANLATLPMNAGTSQNYIVVVQAPAAATAGQTNVTTVTVTPSGALGGVAAPAASNATDSTVVVIGQVTLVKSQVVDTACATTMSAVGVGALTYSQGQIPAAAPNTCIVYRIVATNIGTQNVTLVQIFDTTPPNTTCFGTPFSTNGNAVTVSPAAACTPATTATASLQTQTVTLTPNATVDLYMRVRINP